MSRAFPSTETPSPCVRWFEWAGKGGHVTYFDKTLPNPKKPDKDGMNIAVKLPFPFIVLDELSLVKGWHQPSKSGIISNEVRDGRSEVMVVRSFKGGPIATGLWAPIKDAVKAAGGYFTTNLYIAYSIGGKWEICSLQFAASALGAWMDFRKKFRKEIDTKGVKITGFKEAVNGDVIYRVPVFEVVELKPEYNAEAAKLAEVIKEYLKGYFERTRTEQSKATGKVDAAVQPDAPSDVDQTHGRSSGNVPHEPGFEQSQPDPDDSDVPF